MAFYANILLELLTNQMKFRRHGTCGQSLACAQTRVSMTVVCPLLDRSTECQATLKLTCYLINEWEWSVCIGEGWGGESLNCWYSLNDLRKLLATWLCFSGCPYTRLRDFTREEKKTPVISHQLGISEPTYIRYIEKII